MIRPYYLRDNEDDCQCRTTGLEERHEENHECRVCRKCCADEPMLAEHNDTYEDKGTCIECAMKEDPDLTIEEVAGVLSR